MLDPYGETVTADDAASLPSGRHVGWEADHLLLSPVNMQPSDGGVSRFDRLYLSSHGRSWTQELFLLNGVDVTDPARPGSPLVEPPAGSWDTLEHRSLSTDRPGLEWTIGVQADEPLRYDATAGAGRPLGGGLWLPHGFMDKEPASDFGSPRPRRALADTRDIAIAARGHGTRLVAEYVRDDRVFPVTFHDPDGSRAHDLGERTTVLGTTVLTIAGLPFTALIGWQGAQEAAAGASYRWPRELTGPEHENGLVAQLGTTFDLQGWRLAASNGFGWRDGSFAQTAGRPIVSDLEGEWLWLARPRLDERLSRWRDDLRVTAQRETALGVWRLEARGGYASISSTASAPGGVIGHTYDGTTGTRPAYVDVFDPARHADEWLGNARANATLEHQGEGWRLEGYLGLDWSAAGAAGKLRTGGLAPAAGATVRVPLGGGEVFALVRREPDVMTAEVSAFLDPDRPSGRRYVWNDDGDGVPTSDEAGALVQRFGGPFDRAGSGLRRPSSNQFSLGWRTPVFGAFRALVTGSGRWHLDRYTVRYDDATAAGFTPVAASAHDSGAPVFTPQGGGVATVYARTGTPGSESYVLVNDDRPDWWLGAEVALVTVDTEPWFLSLGLAGYWDMSGAAFGHFPDRNDPGVIDWVSADPNARINAYGRPDQDRSFSVKLLAGRTFFDHLLLATALRYRDGEAFSAMDVVQGLPQGPTPVMLEWRGRHRHTFHMSLDVRAAFSHDIPGVDGLSATLAADVFNLLGSGTELAEDPRRGPSWRQTLEMMPDRAGFIRLTIGWR